MPILAIDTCLGAVSAAVCLRDAAGVPHVAARFEICQSGHAERLMPLIAQVLDEAGVEARALRRVAVTLGPGTFTGVRTGIAAARGLAVASRAEIVGATSLAVIAAGVAAVGADMAAIAVAVSARKGDVFLQLFDARANAITEPALLPLADAAERLTAGTWHMAGSATAALAQLVSERGGSVVGREPEREPEARDLLALAETLTPLAAPKPLYIRPPDALPQSGKALPRANS